MAKIVAYIGYLLFISVGCFTMSTVEPDLSSWQRWVILTCMVGCHICGCVRGW